MTPHVIKVRNVNEAFREGFQWLRVAGIDEDSRNGPVIVAPGPVLTVYSRPWERVLFNQDRDANPVFHLMECIWMMAGRHDAEWLTQFNSTFDKYAEDNGIVHGAYGHRWLQHFGINQLSKILSMLTLNPNDRRAVLTMWDPSADLGEIKNDLPCNTHIYFDMRGNKLNMTVCNRSNDILWGAYGANAVHMSFLQEVLASVLGTKVGHYCQMSNNFHAYTDTAKKFILHMPQVDDLYADGSVIPHPINPQSLHEFVMDCSLFVMGQFADVENTFLRVVAQPLCEMYLARKRGDKIAIPKLDIGIDWFVAFKQWLERRENNGCK